MPWDSSAVRRLRAPSEARTAPSASRGCVDAARAIAAGSAVTARSGCAPPSGLRTRNEVTNSPFSWWHAFTTTRFEPACNGRTMASWSNAKRRSASRLPTGTPLQRTTKLPDVPSTSAACVADFASIVNANRHATCSAGRSASPTGSAPRRFWSSSRRQETGRTLPGNEVPASNDASAGRSRANAAPRSLSNGPQIQRSRTNPSASACSFARAVSPALTRSISKNSRSWSANDGSCCASGLVSAGSRLSPMRCPGASRSAT